MEKREAIDAPPIITPFRFCCFVIIIQFDYNCVLGCHMLVCRRAYKAPHKVNRSATGRREATIQQQRQQQ